jgi:shikimate kinase
MKIILIGYRCVGKSTISKKLAEKLGIERVSLDEVFEEENGSIKVFVEKNGWEKFRKIESEIAMIASEIDDKIIDTGGGIVENSSCMKALKKKSIVIWLKADYKKIIERKKLDDNRPEFTEDDEIIYKRREPLYKKYSDMVFDTTDSDVEDIISKICETIKNDG